MSEHPADVVISDLDLGVADGVSLIKEMRSFAPQSEYIMVTGAGDLDSAMRALNEAHVFRFFTKPCPVEDLVESVKDALQRRTAQADSSSESDFARASYQRSRALKAAFDTLAHPFFIVDRDGLILHLNSGAECFLKKHSTYVSINGAVRNDEKPYLNASFDGELGYTLKHRDIAGPELVSLTCAARGETILAHFTPLTDFANPGFAVIILADEAPLLPDDLRRIFNLTRTEARFASVFANDPSLEVAAASMGIAVETARKHLKSVFAKTNHAKQADLIKLLDRLRSPFAKQEQ